MMEPSKIISTSDFLTKLQEFLDETDHTSGKKQKINTFENLCEILSNFDVAINEKPVDKVRI